MEFTFLQSEKQSERGENVGNQHTLLCPLSFQKLPTFGSVKIGTV